MANHRDRNLQVLLDQLGPISLSSGSAESQQPPPIPFAQPLLVLDVRRLHLLGVLRDRHVGQLVWGHGSRPQPAGLYTYDKERLTIHEVNRDAAILPVAEPIEVVWLSVFGQSGARPWLVCPRRTEAGSCGQRAMKLYLRDGDSQFACRACLGRHRRSLPLSQITTATAHHLPA